MALRLPLALACAFLAASPVLAETVDVRAGRLIDPETGEVRSDQRIRIVDGKIAGISPWQADGGPATVDWSGFNVLPGLIPAIFPSTIRMRWSVLTWPVSGSIRRPARTSTVSAEAGEAARNAQASASGSRNAISPSPFVCLGR